MFTKTWWHKTLERIAKTAAQTIMWLVPAKFMNIGDFAKVDWLFIALSIVVMAVLSLASSVVTTPAGPNPEDPSAV